MTLPPPTRRRRTALAVVGALAVASAVVLGITRPWMPPAETAPVAAAAQGISPAPLVLPEHPRVLVFGDSWTFGTGASTPESGYAYQLADRIHGETVVRGVPGSGYQRPGMIGPVYGERIAALEADIDPDLVIIQGSINDRREDPKPYRQTVNAAWDTLAATYPRVPIVVLGPAAHELPVGASTARIDRDLAAMAAQRNWWYISPVREEWITEERYLELIDVGVGRKHPSDAGHAYLADRVAAKLTEFAGAPVTAADGARELPAK